MNADLIHFFVYGTLKRGECREKCWPRPPAHIEPAWTLGTLFDTGPYPALRPGDDPVLGEVWSFNPDDFAAVASEIDEVEDYQEGRSNNLYTRQLVPCQTLNGHTLTAFTYIYAQMNALPTFTRLTPEYTIGDKCFSGWFKLSTPVDCDNRG